MTCGKKFGMEIQASIRVTRIGSRQRREETVLTRLRPGHCMLNKTLKLVGKHPTGLCEGCQEEESVEHVVMNCRRYERHREVLSNKLRELFHIERCTKHG